MSMRQDYEAYLERHGKISGGSMGNYYLEQESRYVPPFHIYGPVWYVGDSWVCVHLIDTGEGLLLIDSGNLGSQAMLIYSIWKAGFDPADVKWIVHSHGHLDHFGASLFFKRMFGTKLYLGEPDARMFREKPWLSLVQGSHNDCDELFVPDHEIADGEVMRFGSIEMTCYHCPGHTEGVISLFFDADGAEGVKRFGYYGGFGFNTLQEDYLVEIGDKELRTREVYLRSLQKVRDQKVEIMLGNHCVNNDTLGRRRRQIEDPDGPNPFIDEKQWGAYLDLKMDEVRKLMGE